MFDSIMKEYQLQEEYWSCIDSNPIKLVNRYVLHVNYEAPRAYCPHCQETKFHRHGAWERTVQLTEYMGYPCFLMINIQRYKCVNCRKASNRPLPQRLVSSGQKDSVLLKKQVVQKLRSKTSIKEAAESLHVSSHSFYRLLDQISEQPKHSTLPKVLCVDELKATKDCTGNMAFVAMNGESHELILMLDDRRIETLVRYFMTYKRAVREQVQYLVMDMNASYEQLVKRCFPNAQVVTDRFHIVQQMTRAFNQLRIKIMKKYDTKSPQYRHMKYFWRHLLKDYDDLSDKPFYSRSFRKWTDSKSVVECIISEDEELMVAWQSLQMAMTHFKRKDPEAFFGLIESLGDENLDEDFVKKYQFLLRKRDSIQLAMELPYSNGCIEGMNNKIKALKRAAFGFRTYRNFSKRVFLMNI